MSQQEYITNYNDDAELQEAFEELDAHIKRMDERKQFMERELKGLFETRQNLWIAAEKLLEQKDLIDNADKYALWYNKKGQVFAEEKGEKHPLAGIFPGLFES